ncbi:universal stress protein [Knoellia sp. CPCC 206450]|uniref:universal stress protein n=1 Tax=Knoellia tibetensis TaxID=3404798 RepID=UPI003B434DDB
MPVIVGFVPTKEGRAALDAAVVEARSRGSRLLVVNASTGAASADNRYVDDAQLTDLRTELDASGLDYEISHAVHRKDPAEVLVDLAEQTNAELIVIGVRRRTPVGKLLLGSQAQQVLLDAECPVLAVKAPR